MKIGVEYLRYSSERQTEQSIEGQMRVCDEYARKNNIVIADRYIDRAMTGKNDNREAFQKMLSDSAKKAWDYVLVYKIDRFGRNKYEIAINKHTLRNNGVKVMSVMENIPDTPEGIILESLLEGMAEYYSAELAQKVTRGMRESRLKGQYTGGPVPYGFYTKDKKVYIKDDEAEVIKFIYDQYANDVFVKDIIDQLTEKGILYNGKPFIKQTIYKFLQNEKYTGHYVLGEDTFDNIYPRIVSDEVFQIVREKSELNHFGKHVEGIRYILKNKIKCGYCGSSIISDSGTSCNGTIKRYYKCNGRKNHKCSKSIVRKEIIEDIVTQTTIKVLSSSELLDELAERIIDDQIKKIESKTVEKSITKEISKIQKSIDNLMSAIEKGIVTTSTKERLEQLEKQLDQLNEKLIVEKNKDILKTTKNEIVKFIKTALKKEPAPMINLLVKTIVLFDDKIEIYYNYINKNSPDCDEHRAFIFHTENIDDSYDYHKFELSSMSIETFNVKYYYKVELYI